MLPNSVTLGEKSTSIAIVAALINRIVTIGVRKTATCSSSARLRPKTFQIRLLGRAQDLDTFFREVIVEARERQTGTVNGRLADFSMKADPLPFELQVKLLSMCAIETIDGDHRDILALITA